MLLFLEGCSAWERATFDIHAGAKRIRDHTPIESAIVRKERGFIETLTFRCWNDKRWFPKSLGRHRTDPPMVRKKCAAGKRLGRSVKVTEMRRNRQAELRRREKALLSRVGSRYPPPVAPATCGFLIRRASKLQEPPPLNTRYKKTKQYATANSP